MMIIIHTCRLERKGYAPAGYSGSARPSPKENGRCCCTGHCPSWARAEGDLLGSTRTLLIQRGHYYQPNSSNLPTLTRVRVTQCWSLLAFMLDFAVLYSLKYQVLSRNA
jgi:hypothetical protein